MEVGILSGAVLADTTQVFNRLGIVYTMDALDFILETKHEKYLAIIKIIPPHQFQSVLSRLSGFQKLWMKAGPKDRRTPFGIVL